MERKHDSDFLNEASFKEIIERHHLSDEDATLARTALEGLLDPDNAGGEAFALSIAPLDHRDDIKRAIFEYLMSNDIKRNDHID